MKSGCFDSLGKSRAALLDGLDSAIDVAAAAREAANVEARASSSTFRRTRRSRTVSATSPR